MKQELSIKKELEEISYGLCRLAGSMRVIADGLIHRNDSDTDGADALEILVENVQDMYRSIDAITDKLPDDDTEE